MLQPGDSLLQCLWQPGAGTTFPSPKEWAGFLTISRAPLLLSTVVEAACTGVIKIRLNGANDFA